MNFFLDILLYIDILEKKINICYYFFYYKSFSKTNYRKINYFFISIL